MSSVSPLCNACIGGPAMQLRDRRRELAIAPLWRLGFRPFFLAGSAFALLAVAAWLGVLSGALQDWQPTGGWLA
ncbi:NnrS family protein, partial [Metapseudomonas otitidis]|uniref:NnrS family protein n=1 Tax=Metapseudomonas otitidis TaxID=319939 RepID=UPI003B9EEF80